MFGRRVHLPTAIFYSHLDTVNFLSNILCIIIQVSNLYMYKFLQAFETLLAIFCGFFSSFSLTQR